MQDVAFRLQNTPGELARFGQAVGAAGISIEGGGAWACGTDAVAHFLFADGEAARQALAAAGIQVIAVRDVLVQKLNQELPGQLGRLTSRMAAAGVNIEVLYSDHANQIILVVDDYQRGAAVSAQWEAERTHKEAQP